MALHQIHQKFQILPNLLPLLRSNASTLPFRSLRALGTTHFTDTYLDSGHKLSRHGIWVRKRELIWECKRGVRTRIHSPPTWKAQQRVQVLSMACCAPCTSRTVVHTTSEVNEIVGLVAPFVDLEREITEGEQGAEGVLGAFGLDVIARMETVREEWAVDEEMLVRADALNFGWCVGEVRALDRGCIKMVGDERNAQWRLEAFSKRYQSVFGRYEEEPKSKFEAYYERFGYPHIEAMTKI